MDKSSDHAENNIIQFIHIKKMHGLELCRNTSSVNIPTFEAGSKSNLIQYIYIKDGNDLERLHCGMTLQVIYDIFKSKQIEVAGYTTYWNPNQSKIVPTKVIITITDDKLSKTILNEFFDKLNVVKDLGYIKIKG